MKITQKDIDDKGGKIFTTKSINEIIEKSNGKSHLKKELHMYYMNLNLENKTTKPINKIIPIREIILRSVRVSNKASKAPTPAEGNVERMVIG